MKSWYLIFLFDRSRLAPNTSLICNALRIIDPLFPAAEAAKTIPEKRIPNDTDLRCFAVEYTAAGLRGHGIASKEKSEGLGKYEQEIQ